MSWIGDKAEATANVLKDLLTQTPAAKLYRQGLPNVLDALLNTREEEWRSKIQAMPKPFDASPEAVNRDMEAAMAFWNPAGMLGKIVYHGSPHKFDKFDASKIGTGEGAQAYGHGVYLADAEGVAKGYAENLKKYPVPEKLAELIPERKYFDPAEIGEFYSAARDSNLTGKTLWNRNRTLRDIPPEKIQSAIEEIRKAGEGALYKADLPDEWIPKMLDWDKPLSQQSPEVKKAIAPFVPKKNGSGQDWPTAWDDLTGADIARPSDPAFMADRAAGLQQAGVTGIRYLDGGSRGAGQGSYNYVVFPGLEDQVKILERNGQPVNMIVDALMRSRR